MAKDKKKGLNKSIIVFVIIIVIVIILSISLVLINQNNNKNSEESNEVVVAQTSQEHSSDASVDPQQEKINTAFSKLRLTKDIRPSLAHGKKTKEHQKYIVLHDTEGEGNAKSVINGWDANGRFVAAQYVVNKDGSIYQCVENDVIAHHSGFGDTGHNQLFDVPEDGRDDKRGATPVGSWASDYGMNSWSIGIEIVHVGGSGFYPEAQLQALDNLIAYLDAYYGGNAGKILDHKEWRSGNSDTSAEFSYYLANYKSIRRHDTA